MVVVGGGEVGGGNTTIKGLGLGLVYGIPNDTGVYLYLDEVGCLKRFVEFGISMRIQSAAELLRQQICREGTCGAVPLQRQHVRQGRIGQ
jgi:hypothetical protein